jgi:hypothetical protein
MDQRFGREVECAYNIPGEDNEQQAHVVEGIHYTRNHQFEIETIRYSHFEHHNSPNQHTSTSHSHRSAIKET